MTRTDEDLRRTALAVVLQSHENHKNHARFQETQRSWFLLAYLSVVGVIGAAILNRVLQPARLDDAGRAIIVLGLAALMFIGILVGMAIVKVGVAFRRHYHQAEGIVSVLLASTAGDETLQALLRLSKLGTSGDENRGIGRFVAKRFGVAAIHNYLISSIIGMEAAGAAALLLPRPVWSLLIFPIATAWAIFTLQAYRSIIYVPER
jgi:hypothetical protein